MFKEVVALSREKHRALRFNPRQTYQFAASEMAVPIFAGEANLVAREYPILFATNANSMPMALLSLEKDGNAYVTEQGKWDARYVPVHVRRYPFMLGDTAQDETVEGSRAFTVMFDAAAPHLQEANGDSLFNDAGAPAPALEKVQRVLIDLQRNSLATLKLVQKIDAAGVLQARVLEATPKGGKPFAIKGMRVVDAKKLAALPAEVVHDLHVSGALALIHAHLISMTNLQDGQLMKGVNPPASAHNGTDLGFLSSDGTLNLSSF